MNRMNKGFINRNRIFWMNTRGMTQEKVLINENLFEVPEDIASRDEIVVDINYSNRQSVIGVVSQMDDNVRKYYTYENDELGQVKWKLNFDTFKKALTFGKIMYNIKRCQNQPEMYDTSIKTLKR